MALSTKREGLKHVPWFSLTEWHQVYKQLYSNDAVQQTKAYETLVAWKTRIPKLPVGIDCTLSLMQVCLRDREWTSKIADGSLPINYEDDLCLMYSTAIMRFLNHISNIGHTKQTSLFQIAKQLRIPEWIVNLRHDAAHGYELPSIGVLRIAVNTLLAWLHDEYWAAEAVCMEDYYAQNDKVLEMEESDEAEALTDLFELWTSIRLYMHAGYELVSCVPDVQLRETLHDLRSYIMSLSEENKRVESDEENSEEIRNSDIGKEKRYTLVTAQSFVLLELSRFLGKYKLIPNKEDVILNALFDSEAFLPSPDILPIFTRNEINLENQLPIEMIGFWEAIIRLLHQRGMLEALILKLLKLVDNERENDYKKLLASLWIKAIAHGLVKIDAAQTISQKLEQELGINNTQIPMKLLNLKIKETVDRTYPDLKDALWLNISKDVPQFLTNINFVSELILKANKFYIHFVKPVLELVTPQLDLHKKQCLLDLIEIYTTSTCVEENENQRSTQLYTVEDLSKIHHSSYSRREKTSKRSFLLADQTIRNSHWKLASADYNWVECPIGLLPWQVESVDMLEPLKISSSQCNIQTSESEIIPGIIDGKTLQMRSRVQWDNVLRQKKQLNTKHKKGNADVIMNKAIEVVRNKNNL